MLLPLLPFARLFLRLVIFDSRPAAVDHVVNGGLEEALGLLDRALGAHVRLVGVLLLAREARLVRARHVALSGDTCAAAHSRPPPRTRSASSPQPARWLPTGRLPVARTHTAQHPAAPIYALI